MSKFYTATCQAKELAAEVKTAKDEAKELNHDILQHLSRGRLQHLSRP